MAFGERDAANLLVRCARRCCICWRWCGFRIELHHIKARADGGGDEIENAIPLCFDCHAEVESRGPRGRRYSEHELLEQKRRWLSIVANDPGVLLNRGRSTEVAGPLEALLSELHFNAHILQGDFGLHVRPLRDDQFDRALAANALSVTDTEVRRALFTAYGAIGRFRDQFKGWSTHAVGSNSYNMIERSLNEQRQQLRPLVGAAINALGRVGIAGGQMAG